MHQYPVSTGNKNNPEKDTRKSALHMLQARELCLSGSGMAQAFFFVVFPKRLVSVFTAHLSNSEADEIRSVNAANPFVFMYVFS